MIRPLILRVDLLPTCTNSSIQQNGFGIGIQDMLLTFRDSTGIAQEGFNLTVRLNQQHGTYGFTFILLSKGHMKVGSLGNPL